MFRSCRRSQIIANSQCDKYKTLMVKLQKEIPVPKDCQDNIMRYRKPHNNTCTSNHNLPDDHVPYAYKDTGLPCTVQILHIAKVNQ